MSAPNTEFQVNFIYDGVPATTLGEIFGLDHKDVVRRLSGRVQPVPSKDKYVRYRIRDAAPYLCEMHVDPEEMLERLKKLSPAKWPSALQDAFWKAQLSRQKYHKERGELWNTSRVFEAISGAFKVIRLTILMFVDTVEQRTQLTDEQRRIIQELGDGLLSTLEKSLRDEFADYKPNPDEHGVPLTDQTVEFRSDEEPVAEVDPFD
jgi:hypothetical protein